MHSFNQNHNKFVFKIYFHHTIAAVGAVIGCVISLTVGETVETLLGRSIFFTTGILVTAITFNCIHLNQLKYPWTHLFCFLSKLCTGGLVMAALFEFVLTKTSSPLLGLHYGFAC